MKISALFKMSVLCCGLFFAAMNVGCSTPAGQWFANATKTNKYRFIDPSKVIRAEASPVNPIYNVMGEADTTEELPPNATFPELTDLSYESTDYVIGPNDVLAIYIMDLYDTNVETVVEREVSASGYIDLPMLPERIKAEGYSQEQLTEIIKQAYSPDIIMNPTIAVRIAAPRQNTFSILGAVGAPGTYNIIKKDMRLLEALAMARGFTQENIRYLYVIRPRPALKTDAQEGFESESLPELPRAIRPPAPQPELPVPTESSDEQGEQAAQPEENAVPVFDPAAALRELGAALPGAATAPETPAAPQTPQPSEMLKMTDTDPISRAAVASAQAQPQADAPSEKWVYSGGKWIRVVQDTPDATQPSAVAAPPQSPEVAPAVPVEKSEPAAVYVEPRKQPTGPAPIFAEPPQAPKQQQVEQLRDPYNWRNIDSSDLARVVAVNIDRLRNGDLRMNIVVRDGDIIQIPPIKPGEFYVMGEVSRPGPYSLAGRQITVKMAVGAAGNLGPLAWPEHSVLIRRIGNDQEQIMPVNLEAIFSGKEADFFLKPNDVLAVGTDWKTSFMAVIRNAFRMTYGFGLIYDRNFSDPLDINGDWTDSTRFTRW